MRHEAWKSVIMQDIHRREHNDSTKTGDSDHQGGSASTRWCGSLSREALFGAYDPSRIATVNENLLPSQFLAVLEYPSLLTHASQKQTNHVVQLCRNKQC